MPDLAPAGPAAILMTGTERKRVEVVEALVTLSGEGESLAEVAHDARNMVTALGLRLTASGGTRYLSLA